MKVLFLMLFYLGGFFVSYNGQANGFKWEFPEEVPPLRQVWDRGCETFDPLLKPLLDINPAVSGLFPTLFGPRLNNKYPKNWNPTEVDLSKQSQRRFVGVARGWVSAEPGEDPAQVWKSVAELLGNSAEFKNWVMPGINDSGDASQYFVRLDDLKIQVLDKSEGHFVANLPYTFSLLGFERSGVSSLFVKYSKTNETHLPSPCLSERLKLNKVNVQEARRIFVRMSPRPELVELLVGEMFYFPSPVGAEIWLQVQAQASSMVYNLMPESLMRSQLEKRALRIFQNLIEFRRQRVLKSN